MRNPTSFESLVTLLSALAATGCDKSSPTPTPEPSASAATPVVAPAATPEVPPAQSVSPAQAAPTPSASVGAKEIKVAPKTSASGAQMGCAPGGCAPGACAANKK